MKLPDKTGAFHIQMPYLTWNIGASYILNYGWWVYRKTIKLWVVGVKQMHLATTIYLLLEKPLEELS